MQDEPNPRHFILRDLLAKMPATGSLRLNLQKYRRSVYEQSLFHEELLEQVTSAYESERYEEAFNLIVRELGFVCHLATDEQRQSVYKAASTNVLAVLHEISRNRAPSNEQGLDDQAGGKEKPNPYLNDIQAEMGNSVDLILPSERQLAGYKTAQLQKIGIERGIPSMSITALQKSGSAFVSRVISNALEIPVSKISLNVSYRIVPSRVRAFARGGIVMHDHFPASDENLEELKSARLNRIVVQVRDPVEATFSLYRMGQDRRNSNGELPDFRRRVRNSNNWIAGWLAAQEQGILEVEFLHHSRLASNALDELLRVFPILREENHRLAIERAIKEIGVANKTDKRFNRLFPEGLKEELESELTPEVRALLDS